MQGLNSNQVKGVNILFMVNEIFTREIESVKANKEDILKVFKEKSDREKQEFDEQSNNTNIPELESEESVE